LARSDPGFSRRKEHKGIAQFVRFFDRIFNLLFRQASKERKVLSKPSRDLADVQSPPTG
jgi:hypothetical protein